MPARSLLAAPDGAQDHGPDQADAVVQRQAHPDRARVDEEVARHPQRPHVDVVLHAIPPILGARPLNGGLELHAASRPVAALAALNELLEKVEDWVVDKGVVDEVVVRSLFQEVDLPGTVLQLLGPAEVGEADRVGADAREDRDVDEPLHDAEVREAEGREDAVPAPVDVLLALALLHDDVGQRSLHRGHDDVRYEGPALGERRDLPPDARVLHVDGDAVALRRGRRPRGPRDLAAPPQASACAPALPLWRQRLPASAAPAQREGTDGPPHSCAQHGAPRAEAAKTAEGGPSTTARVPAQG
mmetsp:Transcript_105766/g.329684  ORF Transcript_105766/g.329684 Transcript_105766/m.329684 type:complete len:301 (+) Transcript_105766:149-1051(+)